MNINGRDHLSTKRQRERVSFPHLSPEFWTTAFLHYIWKTKSSNWKTVRWVFLSHIQKASGFKSTCPVSSACRSVKEKTPVGPYPESGASAAALLNPHTVFWIYL